MWVTLTYNDGQNVLGTGLVVQPLSSVDDAQGGVDAEQKHATGVYGAMQKIGQLMMFITVWSQNLDHLSVRWHVFKNGDIIGWLGKDGIIVIVVNNSNVNLEQEGERWNKASCQTLVLHLTTLTITSHYKDCKI